MKNSAIVVIILAVLVVFGGWYAYTNYYTASPTPSTDTTQNTTPSGTDNTQVDNNTDGISADINAGVTVGTAMSASVVLTASGFSPKSVTIKKGGTVTFKNESTGAMWVATASHPTHTVYDGTTLGVHCTAGAAASFDQCSSGTTYSFTFSKAGSFNYHNHVVTGQFGTVVVVE
ncbi:MAG: Plastocyanin [Parcubacteria group bacterium Gr01-1014_56]|nr:MAG: Plastocyanin [Parcubacteria group bacterium Gr01-1014_56]